MITVKSHQEGITVRRLSPPDLALFPLVEGGILV